MGGWGSAKYLVLCCCSRLFLGLSWKLLCLFKFAGLLSTFGSTMGFGKFAVLAICLLRTAFVPIFMYANAKPETRSLPVLLRSDLAFCGLLALLALSVGYFGNHCLTNAPKTLEEASSQEAASLILTATFVLGQASGSFLSYFVLKAL